MFLQSETSIREKSEGGKGAKEGGKIAKEAGKWVELPNAEKGKVVVRFPPEASG